MSSARIFLPVVLLNFCLTPSTANAVGPIPDAIVKKADTFRMPAGNLVYLATITEFDGPEELRATRYKVSFSPPDKVRAETRFPTRSVGRNFLMIGNDMWLQTPDIQRPTRIGFQQRLTGEVANGDIARTNFATDYNAELKGEETINGKKTYKLFLKAKNKDVTYSAIHYWVDTKTSQPVQAEFLTSEMKVLKRGFFKKPSKVLGQLVFLQLELMDGINPKKRSILEYRDFKKARFKPGTFNKDALNANGDEI